jgi:serine-type D-Ala-D-Ala carboxypeptidase/endopeptidase (penicillin-binding protein 4)
MRISFAAVFCLFILKSFSQSSAQKIEKAYSAFEKDEQLKYASSSLTVLNAQTGEVLFSRNGNMGLAPASTLKVVTSAAAFNLLGSDFNWETTLGYSGAISAGGLLNGNLILTGGGDPTLGSLRYESAKADVLLKKWVEAVQKSGIKKVSGRLIADDRLFGTQTLPLGWIWQDIGNYYGAGPNSLTWHENQVDLNFKPGKKVGDATTFQKTESDIPGIKMVNEVKTGKAGSGDNVYAFSSPYTNIVYLRGTYGIDLKKPIAISVPDPALEVGRLLQDALEKAGLSFSQPVITSRQMELENLPFLGPDKLISIHSSPNLSQVVYWLNQKSINLYAEHLVKTMAWKAGKDIITENGTEVIRELWNKKSGIDKEAINMVDGSGLSPGNRITTMAMAMILQSAKKETWFKDYLESFPVYNNMKMKSGSINDVLAYAGYQTSSSGTPLVFSFILNNFHGSSSAVRQKMFGVLDTLK